MWVKALDLLLKRMRAEDVPFEKIVAISGSGQQHGTVYLKAGTERVLAELNTREPLANQLMGCFAIQDSPVWMDASTTQECRALEGALGGPQAVADLTGSRAYERFSGNQIARISRLKRDGYEMTERIALVSSFMASLFAGKYVPIDVSDGSGMNLMNIRTKQWDPKALQVSARALQQKLGSPQASHKVAGTIAKYFVDKYGFDPECRIVTFSGDNPCSLAGLRLEHLGDVAVSMGTSDTMFGALAEPEPSASEGHIFVNPIDPESYMAMIVYTNGSLMREEVRDRSAGGEWGRFAEMLESTPPGNEGNIGFFYRDAEITPPIMKPGQFCFDAEGEKVRKFTPEQEVRAVVEGQFLSMRLHSGNVGIKPQRILATGGGSANKGILKVISQVFGVPVYVGDAPSSAAFGAAYRALHGYECEKRGSFVTFAEVMEGAPGFTKAVDGEKCAVYDEMIKRYAELEKSVISECS
jgi:xylulokinase